MFEKKDNLFWLQAGCTTRYLDPTLYDFPALHWQAASYPLNPAALVAGWQFRWGPGPANQLALVWRDEFTQAMRRAGDALQFQPYSRMIGIPRLHQSGEYVEIELLVDDPNDQPSRQIVEAASIVLLAVGFGRERRYLRDGGSPHPCWGYEFWDNDPLDRTNFGVEEGEPYILISGSGDGALQDFLRVTTTCRTTREIYDAIFKHVKLSDEFLRRLLDANDRVWRSFCWGCSPGHDHAPLREIHLTQVEIIEHLFRTQGAAMRYAISDILRAPLPNVSMIYSCDHFSNCYGLNRFLVLILKRYLEELRGGDRFFLSGRRLIDIQPTDGHTCQSDPDGCHGRAHTVTWAKCPDCRSLPESTERGTLPANVLVLRHGIDISDFGWDPSPPALRQILPYVAPD